MTGRLSPLPCLPTIHRRYSTRISFSDFVFGYTSVIPRAHVPILPYSRILCTCGRWRNDYHTVCTHESFVGPWFSTSCPYESRYYRDPNPVPHRQMPPTRPRVSRVYTSLRNRWPGSHSWSNDTVTEITDFTVVHAMLVFRHQISHLSTSLRHRAHNLRTYPNPLHHQNQDFVMLTLKKNPIPHVSVEGEIVRGLPDQKPM